MSRTPEKPSMNITFSEGKKAGRTIHQARAEQTFSTGEGHGDCCLTAYGATQDEAHENLRQLAIRAVREIAALKSS
jgi:hypothetical protein